MSQFVLVLLTLVAISCNGQTPTSPSPSPSPSPCLDSSTSSPSPSPSLDSSTLPTSSPSPMPPGASPISPATSLHAIAVPPFNAANTATVPEQERCQGVPARKRFTAGTSSDYWAVVKVTPQSDTAGVDDNVNFCHPLMYKIDNCQGISLYFMEYADDSSITLHTFAYNNRTKSKNHIATNYKKTDPCYAIYQGTPAYIEEYYDDKKYKLVYPIPKFILDGQGVEFAQVGKRSRNWAIFQSCASKITFVILNADTQLRDVLHFEDEYLDELKRLNIDVNTMVDVPFERNRYDEP